MKLADQVAIISGASQGLGFAIAQSFAREGAKLMLCARNAAQLAQAVHVLQQEFPQAQIASLVADVSKLAQMEHLAAYTLETYGALHILVANAGVHGAKGSIDSVDPEEWAQAIEVNLKGTMWQCRAVFPHMKQQKFGKIIIISGGGATKPMPNMSAYAASKAGVVRFAETLSCEVKDFHIDVNTVAPGALNTRLLDDVLNAGEEKVGKAMYQQLLQQKASGGASMQPASQLCVFLASHCSDGITGRLISALWDPWQKLPSLLKDLQATDIYTIRRILPTDRGQAWD
jgi:NAD(P)-dependent dehydrogenase (short-subunit alcohol dehydrogenase family)